MQSPWWSGRADVLTSEPAELVATKLRALYQRRKGRDLFDLWLALTQMALDAGDSDLQRRDRWCPVLRYYCKVMAKEKVTLTLDAGQLAELRDIAGARSLSAAVDSAVGAHLIKLRHLAAVDDWLAELEREHGPVATETLEWAAQIVDRWDAGRSPAPESRRAG